jgi:hypothetical protein
MEEFGPLLTKEVSTVNWRLSVLRCFAAGRADGSERP